MASTYDLAKKSYLWLHRLLLGLGVPTFVSFAFREQVGPGLTMLTGWSGAPDITDKGANNVQTKVVSAMAKRLLEKVQLTSVPKKFRFADPWIGGATWCGAYVLVGGKWVRAQNLAFAMLGLHHFVEENITVHHLGKTYAQKADFDAACEKGKAGTLREFNGGLSFFSSAESGPYLWQVKHYFDPKPWCIEARPNALHVDLVVEQPILLLALLQETVGRRNSTRIDHAGAQQDDVHGEIWLPEGKFALGIKVRGAWKTV